MRSDSNLSMDESYDYHEIIAQNEFSESEPTKAKEYWSNIPPYSQKAAIWSTELAEKIISISPKKVFEFGCNSGKNLLEIRRISSNKVECYGVDINANSIKEAQKAGLNAALGSEEMLTIFPDNTFDVAFTVSVLDHLPEPVPALIELERISKSLFLLEPWMGEEGKVVKNYNESMMKVIETTPFSYSWNYAKLLMENFPGRYFAAEPMPFKSNLGRFYYLFSLK